MKRTRICVLMVVLCFVFVVSGFAQSAIVKSVSGKVEYSNDGSTWSDVKENMRLAKGTIISTSFRSTAVISINDSLLYVKPLTRMSLEDLSKTQDEVQTDLYLVSGKVQVEVKPRAKQEVVNFQVKSAVATASVRGTGFIFDGSRLLVNHGQVDFQGNNGSARQVYGGEISHVTSNGKASLPEYVARTTDSVFDEDEEGSEDGGVSDNLLASFMSFAEDDSRNSLLQSKEAQAMTDSVFENQQNNMNAMKPVQSTTGSLVIIIQ